ncbi:hypothetical protein ABF162_25005 (plasmid) [Vibrio coralliilyticus]|uniref:hypothetical protein n=1 Tax=Vibrio coralliilyticus TaxID=190893 RepID=UPI0005126F9B|nr:hypothetical protein [Vibrio coralliilyticus]AIS58285.1 hypothetical protein JV59_24945 [Vibrio coralliilyticus]
MEAEHMIWMGWVMLWALPYLVQSAGVCIGPFKHIAFLDHQLARSARPVLSTPDRLPDLPYTFLTIGLRFQCYCLLFPAMCWRATTRRGSFWLLMGLNFVWIWSVIVGVVWIGGR